MGQKIRRSEYQKIRFLIILFLHLSFVICHLSFAQDIPSFVGEEVVVTASRTPKSPQQSPWNTSVINDQQLNNFKTVAEALRLLAGVDAQSYGSLGALNSIRLRGGNASQVLILVDGRRVNSPTLGMVDLGDYLVDNIERVEVVRASLSAIYGSDAVSGVVNIITKRPGGGKNNFFISDGSFGTAQCKFLASAGNFLLSGDYLKSDGFRQNSDYLAKNVAGKFTTQLTSGEGLSLGIDFSYYDAIKGVPGVPTSEADPYSATEPNDRQTDKNLLAGVNLKGSNFDFKVYQNSYDQKLDPYIWGASVNQTWQTGINWQQNLDFGLGNVLYGIEAREDRGKTTMSGDHTINNYAVFAQDEIDLSEKYNLCLSLRGDKHSTAGTTINPRVGLTYQPDNLLTFKASAGTAFRAPTLNELYWNDGWMFGNSSLKPEKAFTFDLGLERQITENSLARVNYFSAITTDMILWDWQTSTIETRARNVGEVYAEGVEFEWQRDLGSRGKAFINYTYQRAVAQKDFDPLAIGKQIRYTPQEKYNAGVVYNDGSVLIRHVGERYADQYNTLRLPAYTVVDLKLAKKIKGVVFSLLVNNLFNEVYSEAVGNDPVTYAVRNYPLPGRQYAAEVKWEW